MAEFSIITMSEIHNAFLNETEKQKVLAKLRAWHPGPHVDLKKSGIQWEKVNNLIQAIEANDSDITFKMLVFIDYQLQLIAAIANAEPKRKIARAKRKANNDKQHKEETIIQWIQKNCAECTAKEIKYNLTEQWQSLALTGKPPALSTIHRYKKKI